MKMDHSTLTDSMARLFSHIPQVYARQVIRNVINRNGINEREMEDVLDILIIPTNGDGMDTSGMVEYETYLLKFLLHEALNHT